MKITNKAPLLFIILTVALVIITLITLTEEYIQYSAFTISLSKGFFGILLFWVIDKVAIDEVDTIDELKKGNVAYAIFLLGIAFIIGVAMFGA